MEANGVVAVQESPARRAADVHKPEYVQAWLEDLGGVLAESAKEYADMLAAAGYGSKRSLRGLNDVHEVMDVLKVPRGLAKDLVLEAQAMHTRTPVRPMADRGGGDGVSGGVQQVVGWSGFEGKLVIDPDQQRLEVAAPRDLEAMKAYIMGVGIHVAAYDAATARVVSEFMDDMYEMCADDTLFQQMKLKVGPWESVQLAAVLTAGLPQQVQRYMASEVTMLSGGLEVLRALTKPFRKQAGEGAIVQSTEAVLRPEAVDCRCDLLAELAGWKKHLQVLEAGKQVPSDMQLRGGLMHMISKLQMADDVSFEERMAKRDKVQWTKEKLLALVEDKAVEWVSEPRPKRGKAKRAVSTEAAAEGTKPHCIHWLHKGWCSRMGAGCKYGHDPAAKLRKDLVPVCPSVVKGRQCKFANQPGACWYRHPEQSQDGSQQQQGGQQSSGMEEFVAVAKEFMQGFLHDNSSDRHASHVEQPAETACHALHMPTLKSCIDENASDLNNTLQAGQQGCHRASVGVKLDNECEGVAISLSEVVDDAVVQCEPSGGDGADDVDAQVATETTTAKSCMTELCSDVHDSVPSDHDDHDTCNVGLKLDKSVEGVAMHGCDHDCFHDPDPNPNPAPNPTCDHTDEAKHDVQHTSSCAVQLSSPSQGSEPVQHAAGVQGVGNRVMKGAGRAVSAAVWVAVAAVMSAVGCAATACDSVYRWACLDSGATVDVLGKHDCDRASHVQPVSDAHVLETAANTVQVDSVGDCTVVEGLEVRQGWMAPWMQVSLLSLTQRLKDGYMMVAHGDRAVLVSPDGSSVGFQEQDGLLKPCVGGSNHAAYRSSTVKVKHNKVIPNMNAVLGALVCMAVVEYMMNMPGMSSDVVKYGMPMLSLLKMSMEGNGIQKSVQVPRQTQKHRHVKQSPLEHARRGHMPHDDSCEVCRMSRMRAPMAKKTDGKVMDADKGYVIGVDYAGPFEPDVDGNVYALFGVEVGHTKY